MNILKRTLAGLLVVYLAFGQVTVIPGDWVQGFSSLTTAGSNVYVTGTGTIGQDTSFTRSAAGRYTLYDTTASTGVTTLTVRAGAGQSSTNLQAWQNSGGANLATVSSAGELFSNAGFKAAASGYLLFAGRSQIQSSADGNLIAYNSAGTDFTRWMFGGTSNSFNAISRDTVNGFTVQSAAGTTTYNDASTSASGTVANRYLFGIAAPTLTATNASTTNTVASTVYIGGEPTASTNVTITTGYALNVAAGKVNIGGTLIVATQTPASAAATGTAGTIAWDASYIYICTATNTWKRVAIATW